MSDTYRTTFSGRHLAPAWLSVMLASSTYKEDPIFYRTMALEFYPNGARLTATDRYMMLTSWVPALDAEHTAGKPELEESPDKTIILRDGWGRGVALMTYVMTKLLGDNPDDDDEAAEVTLSLADATPGYYRGQQALHMEGLDQVALAVEVPNRERLRLPLLEGEWPNWRALVRSFVPKRTEAIALNPEYIGRLAKVGKLHRDSPVVWRFGGVDHAAWVEVGEPPVEVSGIVMPVRWRYGEATPDGYELPDGLSVTVTRVSALRDGAGDHRAPSEETDDPDKLKRWAEDELLSKAADEVVKAQLGSAAMLQRKLHTTFDIAAHLMEILESFGVVGPPDGSKARVVLMSPEELQALRAQPPNEEPG